MKQFLILIMLFTSFSKVNAQNIVDFFYSIPAKYIDNLSFIERKNLVTNKRLVKYDMVYYLEIDKKNGYLRLDQSYDEGPSGYQIFEITYWNLKDKKLIAISSIAGSNGGFFQSNFKLFEYEKEALKEIKTGYLKSYTSNFDIFMNNLINEFTKPNANQSIKNTLATSEFTIKLPKNDKDILISFEENAMSAPDYFEKNYGKFLKMRKKKYVWNSNKQIFE